MRLPVLALGVGLVSLIARPSGGADHLNLESGLPVAIEDAYPIPRGGFELLTLLRAGRFESRNESLLSPILEWGFADGWEAKLTVPWHLGGTEEGVEEVGVEVLYNFNAETLKMPAFALTLGGDVATKGSAVDPALGLIVTRTLGRAWHLDRLHLNLGARHNSDRRRRERNELLRAALGYSRRLDAVSMLVTDVVFEQREREGRESLLLEAGVRHQLSPLTVFSVGVGLSRDSPDFRIAVGFQRAM
ncbi:MAG: hypothetical protein VYE73_06455 [Acidobacteriota bacterium]|nr:hypothetical protein [Acidobacteriota bacterium]